MSDILAQFTSPDPAIVEKPCETCEGGSAGQSETWEQRDEALGRPAPELAPPQELGPVEPQGEDRAGVRGFDFARMTAPVGDPGSQPAATVRDPWAERDPSIPDPDLLIRRLRNQARDRALELLTGIALHNMAGEEAARLRQRHALERELLADLERRLADLRGQHERARIAITDADTKLAICPLERRQEIVALRSQKNQQEARARWLTNRISQLEMTHTQKRVTINNLSECMARVQALADVKPDTGLLAGLT